MTPGQLAQLRALALLVESMRAQIDALLANEGAPRAEAPATCATCGGVEMDSRRLDGSTVKVCTVCGLERVA